VERESDVDMADLEESNMDLVGLLSLKDNNSTEKVSNSSSELEKSEVKSGRGVVVVVT
jgi:hypothetical protein